MARRCLARPVSAVDNLRKEGDKGITVRPVGAQPPVESAAGISKPLTWFSSFSLPLSLPLPLACASASLLILSSSYPLILSAVILS